MFLKEYGIQPKQYLISQRINYAKELLILTDLKLDIVARSCGYNDPVHFMKEFKSRVGVSAGLFRKARWRLQKQPQEQSNTQKSI